MININKNSRLTVLMSSTILLFSPTLVLSEDLPQDKSFLMMDRLNVGRPNKTPSVAPVGVKETSATPVSVVAPTSVVTPVAATQVTAVAPVPATIAVTPVPSVVTPENTIVATKSEEISKPKAPEKTPAEIRRIERRRGTISAEALEDIKKAKLLDSRALSDSRVVGNDDKKVLAAIKEKPVGIQTKPEVPKVAVTAKPVEVQAKPEIPKVLAAVKPVETQAKSEVKAKPVEVQAKPEIPKVVEVAKSEVPKVVAAAKEKPVELQAKPEAPKVVVAVKPVEVQAKSEVPKVVAAIKEKPVEIQAKPEVSKVIAAVKPVEVQAKPEVPKVVAAIKEKPVEIQAKPEVPKVVAIKEAPIRQPRASGDPEETVAFFDETDNKSKEEKPKAGEGIQELFAEYKKSEGNDLPIELPKMAAKQKALSLKITRSEEKEETPVSRKKSRSQFEKKEATLTKEEDAVADYHHALSLISAGDNLQAEEVLLNIMKKVPSYRGVRVELAKVYLKANRTPEAEKLLKEGLLLSENYAEFMKLMAIIHERKNEPELALEYIDKIPNKLKQDLTTAAFVGQLYQQTGRFALARNQYYQLLQREPYNPVWLLGVAIALDSEGKRKEALDGYRRLQSEGSLERDLLRYVEERIDHLKG